ncbi:alcohol dehydrogenase catalytic domain-containing protein [Novosphingobium taihuense]|uniref:(R,R)-butanediol dehydrogenase/meso-butanediol dehydrogenase/diacetyl reductase n=1 Tax=Novosphingobium taihuense TaxID=260085 RepID=A0A7W7AEA4_9SPHN|nr:alcohol dehydrogenase catalytic domain-containing protein [Novosphingobium taihuense]MBB4615433.1 (R,R)-butanediol dehydrogenase/meso-butanediol dehydrogenase/diacetyl reductase [Novosphingobium taihuense]TWH82119.1 (R,R)-butanediol dehydrogenase/meso-butanediol dehydrogenase/diacetyl reductase [Novosphingobium taihuense]
MRGLVFNAVGKPLEVASLPDPEPAEGELVIRVSRCGVCGTDLHATSGHGMTLPAGSQLGHEYGGEVVAIGKGVEGWRIGDHLSALPVVGCGHCEGCRTGIDILCNNQWQGYGGGLAEYAKVSARGATRLPQTVSLVDSALVEPLAVGCRAVRLANPEKDARVLIIGPGPIGLSVLFWLRRRGVENVVLLASSGRRRDLAAGMGGTRFVVESDGAKEDIQTILGGAPDVVFEAAGVPGVFGRAVDLVKPQGLIMGLGFCMQPDPIVPAMNLMKDVTMRWSIIYTREDYAACADALAAEGYLARAMVTETVGLDAAPAAFEQFRKGIGGGGKLLVDPWI